MMWKGPYEDGVTQSLVNRFLVCPYRAYLYLILGVKDNSPLHPNLMWGDTFHKGLEHLIEKDNLAKDFSEEDWGEIEDAMRDHLQSKYPEAPRSFEISTRRMIRLYDDSYKEQHGTFRTEEVIDKFYDLAPGKTIRLRGKVDGISYDNYVLVEHKCKGKLEGQLSRLETPTDFQVQLYCLCKGTRKVIYDLIRIPDTQFFMPQRRVNEKFNYYVNSWYDSRKHGDFPVIQNRHLWIDQFPTHQDEESLTEFRQQRLDPILWKICNWWDWVTQTDFDPDNPKFYNEIFYQTPIRHFNPSNTEKFKCEYHDYLTGACGLEDLARVESYYSELEDD